ncbi:NADH-quinone oxidoreductase subunit L [Buchnera aphidicola]|uniref:NADH-quinone oxidoreductase subunit L n=1 Tax=Buchnera aphidicola TaxID=9 RepID=UPI003BEEE4D2
MNIIFFIILFPLMSFLSLSFSQGKISKKNVKNIGICSILISFLISIFYTIQFIHNPSYLVVQKLWTWMSINELNIDIGFMLDGLSLSMLDVVTCIGLLIHIFSIWYMKSREGYSRFFAYTNLFIASMLTLVLADNFLFMYLGWEGVSVCSYLLISFYYSKEYNVQCAFKAFIITRISDIFLMIAFFLIYQKYGTLNFQDIYFLSNILNIDNIFHLNIINILLLIGVIGKSAQLPLQTWLTDAMVGPTPVSALIHAATMVTVGIYLISRIHFLFLFTPEVLYCISFIGILTILLSSLSAIVQTDIKRILAYSTMSQIGYMFLALGIQAWSAAIIHLIMHAIFKALLFLSAGSLILESQNEKNIFKMSISRKKSLFLYFNFLVGGASLISFPLLTSGFYSKGNILFSVLQSGHLNFFFIALFCSFLTSIYTFRMIFVIFHRNNIQNITLSKGLSHNFPLFFLLIGSTFIGSFIFPPLCFVFPSVITNNYGKLEFEIMSSMISILGVFVSYYLWVENPIIIYKINKIKIIKKIFYFLYNGWGFNWFYNIFFKKLYLYVSKILSFDFITISINSFIYIITIINRFLLKTVNGYIRDYILFFVFSIIVIFMFILFFIN